MREAKKSSVSLRLDALVSLGFPPSRRVSFTRMSTTHAWKNTHFRFWTYLFVLDPCSSLQAALSCRGLSFRFPRLLPFKSLLLVCVTDGTFATRPRFSIPPSSSSQILALFFCGLDLSPVTALDLSRVFFASSPCSSVVVSRPLFSIRPSSSLQAFVSGPAFSF